MLTSLDILYEAKVYKTEYRLSRSNLDDLHLKSGQHAALLGLSQRELSELANVGRATLKRSRCLQNGLAIARHAWKLSKALEKAGVEFIPEDDLKDQVSA